MKGKKREKTNDVRAKINSNRRLPIRKFTDAFRKEILLKTKQNKKFN